MNKTQNFDVVGDVKIMNLLIRNGANINAVNNANESGQFICFYLFTCLTKNQCYYSKMSYYNVCFGFFFPHLLANNSMLFIESISTDQSY